MGKRKKHTTERKSYQRKERHKVRWILETGDTRSLRVVDNVEV